MRWLVAGHAQGLQQGYAEEKCGEAGLPDHARGPVKEIGEYSPGPSRGTSHANSVKSLRDVVESQAGQRRKDAVEGQNDPGRGPGVNPKHLEYSGENVWIDRGCPGAWSSGKVGGGTEALPTGNGPGQATHLPAKLKVIAPRSNAVSVPDTDHGEPEYQRDQDNEEDRMSKLRPWRECRRLLLVATLHCPRI